MTIVLVLAGLAALIGMAIVTGEYLYGLTVRIRVRVPRRRASVTRQLALTSR